MLNVRNVRFNRVYSALSCVAALLYGAPVLAKGTDMFVCTSPDGIRTYQNSDSGDGCVPLNLNPITVVPTSKATSVGSSNKQMDDGGYSGGNGGGSGAGGSSGKSSRRAAANDPRTSADFNAKDDRMKILQEELRVEESKLRSLQDEYKGGQPDRLGNEKNYQKYLDRTSRLDKEIKVTTENIQILKAELIRLSE